MNKLLQALKKDALISFSAVSGRDRRDNFFFLLGVSEMIGDDDKEEARELISDIFTKETEVGVFKKRTIRVIK